MAKSINTGFVDYTNKVTDKAMTAIKSSINITVPKESDNIWEQRLREESKKSAERMYKAFTLEEITMISHVPLVISHIAWHYAEKVTKQCADLRISETRGLCRAVKQLRADYIADLRKDLPCDTIKIIELEAEELIKAMNYEFLTLWMSVNNEFKRCYPEYSYIDMMTDAYITKYMVDFFHYHNAQMRDLVREKLGNAEETDNQWMIKLRSLMIQYIGDCKIEYIFHFHVWHKMFENVLPNIRTRIFEANS